MSLKHCIKILTKGRRALPVSSLSALLALGAMAFAEPPSRLPRQIQTGQTFELTGNIHPRVATSEDLGTVPASQTLQRVTLHFQRSAQQEQQLQHLLQQQQQQGSAQFHQWLTPEQFADRFGVSTSDAAKVSAWLQSQGFSNIEVARSRTSISASATADVANAAFQTTIHRFQGANAVRYANTTNPVLPLALRGFISGISGLNDFHPRAHIVRHDHPHFTSSISGNHFLVPGDFATIYDLNPLYSAGIDGSGQKLAVAGETDINLAQVSTFRSNAGLSANTPQLVLDGTDPGVVADEQIEAYLDVEWAGAVAPGATILYVNSTDVFESVRYAIDNNLAPVVSVTYGLCEAQQNDTATLNSLFQQANAQGITITAASGDTGAADCDSPSDPNQNVTTAKQGLAVDFPASSPYVTGVGGTEFSEGNGNYWASTNTANQASALSYIPEVVWNDTASAGTLAASGGGASTLFSKPTWQTGTGVPNDNARDVPDVALNASVVHDEYLVCASDGTTTIQGKAQIQDCTSGFRDVNQDLDAVGGTSAGSPAFAGVVVLMNQLYGSRQGNVNPRLYSLASTSTDVFHDVATGNNQVPCTAGSTDCPSSGQLGYIAGTGYDQTTGLGSVDGAHLVDEWQPGFQVSASPTSLTVAANSSASDTISVTTVGGFAGTVTLSCAVSSVLTNTTCSIPSGGLTSSGAVTLTISRGAAAQVPFMGLPPHFGGFSRYLAGFAALALIAATLFAPRRRRYLAPTLAVLGFAVLAGCGGGSSSTSTSNVSTSVTGTVTVTATSSNVSHTATISVTED